MTERNQYQFDLSSINIPQIPSPVANFNNMGAWGNDGSFNAVPGENLGATAPMSIADMAKGIGSYGQPDVNGMIAGNQAKGYEIGGGMGQGDSGAPAGMSGFQMAQVGIGAGSALLKGYLGMKQYGLAKEQLAFAKSSYNENLKNTKKTINSRIEGKARSRYSSNPDFYQNPDDYLATHKV
jgi:hypothetical protein